MFGTLVASGCPICPEMSEKCGGHPNPKHAVSFLACHSFVYGWPEFASLYWLTFLSLFFGRFGWVGGIEGAEGGVLGPVAAREWFLTRSYCRSPRASVRPAGFVLRLRPCPSD